MIGYLKAAWLGLVGLVADFFLLFALGCTVEDLLLRPMGFAAERSPLLLLLVLQPVCLFAIGAAWGRVGSLRALSGGPGSLRSILSAAGLWAAVLYPSSGGIRGDLFPAYLVVWPLASLLGLAYGIRVAEGRRDAAPEAGKEPPR